MACRRSLASCHTYAVDGAPFEWFAIIFIFFIFQWRKTTISMQTNFTLWFRWMFSFRFLFMLVIYVWKNRYFKKITKLQCKTDRYWKFIWPDQIPGQMHFMRKKTKIKWAPLDEYSICCTRVRHSFIHFFWNYRFFPLQ